MHRRWGFAALSGLVLALTCVVDAQTVAERPDWRSGERWRYQRTAEPSGKVDNWSRTLGDPLPGALLETLKALDAAVKRAGFPSELMARD